MLATVGIGSAGATVCGDADGNGVVTTNDGVRILVVAATDGTCPTDACDVNGDGHISVTDAVLTLQRAVGLPIVEHCGPGAISGRLLVLPADVANARIEREPNDGPGTADVVGRISAGDVRRVRGTLAADDPFDGFTLTSPDGVTLSLALTFPADPAVDLDLIVDDRHGHAVTCESTARGREHCEVTLGRAAAEAFDVVVAPALGSAPAEYTLVLRARASMIEAEHGAAASAVVAGAGAGAPIDLEPAVYRGEVARIATGEVVAQMAEPVAGASGRTAGDLGRAALAAVVSDVDMTDALEATIVAPDGTALLTLPAARANAAANGPAGTPSAKRAHAAERARTREVASALATNARVRFAEPNRLVQAARVPRDPLFPEQWPLDALALPDAWNTTIGSSNAIVAVIDTGVRSDHPDLAGRLIQGFDFISNAARANDGDGLDSDPFDPGDLPNTPEGGTFHGTHVTGTIAAATNNTTGVAGVTWRTAVMPLRVLGIGGGTVFDVAQAIRYAARLSNTSGTLPVRRADVINLSLTTSGDDPVLRSAVDAAVAAGVLVVAAAGNTGSDGFLSPAGFANVLSVAATDRLGNPARYSNFGAAIGVAAPGGDTHHDRDADGRPDGILSTLLPRREDYALMQGTSMASAHASGVAALLLGIPGGASASRLREVLLATADDRGAPGRDDHYGAGLLDAARAVRMLAGIAPPQTPLLRLETPSLRVAGDESAPRVPIRNAGGGTLVVTAVTSATDDGESWLMPSIEGAFVRVAVDRDRLGPGVYTGRVQVASNGGDADLAVVAEVAGTPPEDLGPVTVVLRAFDSRTPIASTTTTASADYRYRFDGVPPGEYEIVATTDDDHDGEICDVGEKCGAYPERSAPSAVTVVGGTTTGARDFGLSSVISRADPVP